MARVLVLTNMYPPHYQGGYELSCRDVVDRWREWGHDVRVLTTTFRVDGVSDDPKQAHVDRELTIFLQDGELWSPPLKQRRTIQAENEAILRRHLEPRPDVVSVWHMGAMCTGLLALLADSGIPTVYVVCDDWPTYAAKMDPWIRIWERLRPLAWLARRLTGLSTELPDLDATGSFCFVSESTRKRCVQHSRWQFPDSTVTFSGIDHRDFPPAEKPSPRPWGWKLLAPGRLDSRKGFATAIRALTFLPEAQLLILSAADDPYRLELERLGASLDVGDRVRFGQTRRESMRLHYQEADACLFPSEWDEPFGLVPLEAMACATPVVATGTGGSGEFLVDRNNCLLSVPQDPASIARAVIQLSTDQHLRARLISAGLRTAAELSVDRLARILEDCHLPASRVLGRADG